MAANGVEPPAKEVERLNLRDSDSDSDSDAEEDVPLVEVDISNLSPLSPEVIQNQATINIGTIGHVAHGKSTLVKAISGVHTVKFKNEMERNITIKLGYANAKIYRCENPSCPRPQAYRSYGSAKEVNPPCEVPGCSSRMKLLRHVSFVDCPGHDILMTTMINGTAVMDAAFLLVAGNESCPQPQTSEHLAAIEIMNLRNIIVLQNKIDLVAEEQAEENHKQIQDFIKGTVADKAPIIPISAQLKFNIDVVSEYIVNKIPVPVRDLSLNPKLIVIRSFDVNKPGAEVDQIQGGIAGGTLVTGVLRLGQEIEVRPGYKGKDANAYTNRYRPYRTKIVNLRTENNQLEFAIPGGLIGVGTKIDPSFCRADSLVGNVIGAVGQLPEVWTEIEINYFLLRRLIGAKTDDKKQTKVSKLSKGETLMLNVGSTTVGGRVITTKADLAKISVLQPCCAEIGEKIALSRRIDQHWRLIGWGTVRSGKPAEQA